MDPYSSYYGSPMMNSMYNPMMMTGMGGGIFQPLTSLNQFLFGIQSVIFSLGQAVQIIGMNAQALKQLLESACAMFDHAVATWNEQLDDPRRRRLRTIRWAMVTAATFAAFKLIRRTMSRRRLPYDYSSHGGLHPAPYGPTSSFYQGHPSYGAGSPYGNAYGPSAYGAPGYGYGNY
jgi:hypothetical protein